MIIEIILCAIFLFLINVTDIKGYKIKNKVFEQYINYPNFLKPMTRYEMNEFKKIKGIANKYDYLFNLSYGWVKKPIIDAVSYEVINDNDENSQSDEKNSVLDDYRKLRDEVNDVNFSINNQDESNDFCLKMKM